jgi:DNA processing protein
MSASFIPNPTLRGTDPIDALRLIRSEHVGPMTFFHLVKFCGSVAKAIEMAPGLSQRGGRKKPIVITPKAEAQREFEALTAFGARLLLYGEPEYPRLLQTIADAPPVLTVRGNIHLFAHEKLIGMVGARNASANGCAFARKLASDLGAEKYTVVSGLARGIDTHAHRGSLATGTVAVIGGGIDNIYPPENEALFAEIFEMGAVISEMPFGMKPHAHSFPGRNRIIAGMTRGVAVIEASLKSGSLITANYALDYGREVFAVPGSPMDPRCTGTNGLIKQGATMIESARDIITNLAPVGQLPLAEAESGFGEPPAAAMSNDMLNDARGDILQALSPSPTLLEEILHITGVSPHVLMAVLLELELAGRLQRHPGAKISLRMNVDD